MDKILHHLPPEVRDNRIASQPVTRRTGEGVPAFPRIQCWMWGPSGGARFRPFGPGSGSAQVWGNVKFQGAHGECPCLPFCLCVRTSGGARFRPSTVTESGSHVRCIQSGSFCKCPHSQSMAAHTTFLAVVVEPVGRTRDRVSKLPRLARAWHTREGLSPSVIATRLRPAKSTTTRLVVKQEALRARGCPAAISPHQVDSRVGK